jgi:hypothetical protein
VPQTPIDQLNYESYNGIVVLTGYNSGPCGALVIPATIDGWPVIYIEEPGDNPPPAFARGNTNLTSVTIPGSIASVTAEAFEDCTTLRSVTMDYGVTSIGQWAFSGCTSLTNISIAASVTNIGWFVFDGCSRLTSLPNGVTIYGDGEFSGTGLTNITIPSTVANIPFFAFGQCGNLTNVTILCGVTNIDSSAFYGDPLTSVTFPDSVTSIGGSAYYLCESLTNVVIPASVTQIGSQAFGYADKLTNILFLGNAPAQTADQGGAFASDLGATLYYLPGTTGWTTQFSEATNVLWNPTIQTSGASFGVHSNQFGFNITGTSNIPIAVEACTNLAKPVWTPLTNVTLSNGLFYFSDAQWTNYPGRFYGIGFP